MIFKNGKANDFLPLLMLCFLCDLCGKKNNLHSFWRNLFFSIDANTAKTPNIFGSLSYNQNATLVLYTKIKIRYFPLRKQKLHHLTFLTLKGKRNFRSTFALCFFVNS